jgi:cyclohexa-1,5-dienecarbonyl-CoA hydratase
MATNGRVLVACTGGQASLVWERPPLNVFDQDLLDQLASALRRPEVRAARVVVLQGGGKCWSAGFAVEDHLRPRMARMFSSFREAVQALWDLPGVTLGQVHGVCLGGGLELLMACDLAWAAESATFGQPEVRLGVFPPLGAALYPELLGGKRAAELLFLGANQSAARAEAIGLVNRVVPDAELPVSSALIATTLASYRPETLRVIKRTMRRAVPDPWRRLELAEGAYLEELMASEEAEEGLHAFLEKRAPVWREA